MVTIDSTLSAIRSTLGGIVGASGGPFLDSGPVHSGVLVIDGNARVPGGTQLLRRGLRAEALVRLTPTTDKTTVRTLCIKLPDLYGTGRDQDFLLASSADGVPFHHFTVPAADTSSRLYSSLWMYLAGGRPVLFGVRAAEGEDSEFEFLISEVIGRFRRVGALHLGTAHAERPQITFAARNSGGNLRPLPPVLLYNAG
jgi:hypothetical protein